MAIFRASQEGRSTLVAVAFTSVLFLFPLQLSATETSTFIIAPCTSVQFTEAWSNGPNTVVVPFTLAGRLIVVQATVEKIFGSFLFDTGAECLLLNRRYFRGGIKDVISATGTNGTVSNVTERYLDSVQIEQFTIKNVLANVLDLSAIEKKKNIQLRGILGFSVFSGLEIELDFQNQTIVLRLVDKRGSPLDSRPPWDRPSDSISFFLNRHLITVRGNVGGKFLNFCLDSGAEVNLLDRLVGRKVLKQFTILKRVNIVGVGDKKVEVLAGTLNRVVCGNLELNQMRTLLTNLDSINETLGTSLDGVLGYEFLAGRRILINYGKEKIYILKTCRP